MAIGDWKSTHDIDPAYILYGVLIFSWVEFVWEAYLSIRQRRIYRKNTTTPPELKGIVDDETFEKVIFLLSLNIFKTQSKYILYLGLRNPIIQSPLHLNYFRLDCTPSTNLLLAQFKESSARSYQRS